MRGDSEKDSKLDVTNPLMSDDIAKRRMDGD
jgi:hypothetical protein